jgi:hypothetical protein
LKQRSDDSLRRAQPRRGQKTEGNIFPASAAAIAAIADVFFKTEKKGRPNIKNALQLKYIHDSIIGCFAANFFR